MPISQLPASPRRPRHRWAAGDAVRRDERRTERDCLVPGCGLVKITRHDNPFAIPWTEYSRAGVTFRAESTPPCLGCEVEP